MSYYMDIVRCDLTRTDTSKSIDEIDEMYIEWRDEDGGIDPSENYFKWDDEFINDLVKLAKMDVVGEVVTAHGEDIKEIFDEIQEKYKLNVREWK